MAKAVRPSIEVIGVQSDAAPGRLPLLASERWLEDTTSTFAEGLATRTAFELPQQIMRDLLDDFVLVTESDAARRDPADDRRKPATWSEWPGRRARPPCPTDPSRFSKAVTWR